MSTAAFQVVCPGAAWSLTYRVCVFQFAPYDQQQDRDNIACTINAVNADWAFFQGQWEKGRCFLWLLFRYFHTQTCLVHPMTCERFHCAFFSIETASVGVESIFSVLHKPKVDNMPEYLQRKQQRIDSETKHRRNSQRRNKKRQAQQVTPGDDDEKHCKKSKDSWHHRSALLFQKPVVSVSCFPIWCPKIN